MGVGSGRKKTDIASVLVDESRPLAWGTLADHGCDAAGSKAGEMLAAMEKKPGGGDQSTGNGVLPVPSLDDLGIDKMQSSRWQREAKASPS